jgi:hypothetical protein
MYAAVSYTLPVPQVVNNTRFQTISSNDTCSSLTANRLTTLNPTQVCIYKHDVQ